MVASSLSNQRTSGMGAKRIHCADVPSQISESGGKPAYVEVIVDVYKLMQWLYDGLICFQIFELIAAQHANPEFHLNLTWCSQQYQRFFFLSSVCGSNCIHPKRKYVLSCLYQRVQL